MLFRSSCSHVAPGVYIWTELLGVFLFLLQSVYVSTHQKTDLSVNVISGISTLASSSLIASRILSVGSPNLRCAFPEPFLSVGKEGKKKASRDKTRKWFPQSLKMHLLKTVTYKSKERRTCDEDNKRGLIMWHDRVAIVVKRTIMYDQTKIEGSCTD